MQFQYSPEITLGNILQILTLLAGVGAGYASLVQENVSQDLVLMQHEKEIALNRALAKEAATELKADVKEVQRDVRKLDEKITDYALKNFSSNKR